MSARVLLLRISVWLGLSAGLATHAWGGTPAWVMKTAAQPTPKLEGNPPAVVLFDDTSIEVNESGVATEVHRGAIRILDTTGVKWANARLSYLDKSYRVRGVAAWLIRKEDTVKAKSGRDWEDISDTTDATIYGEHRTKLVDLSSDTAKGDVFAFETTLELPLLISQVRYIWGWKIPVLSETFRLSIPVGFKMEPILHGETPPIVSSPDRHSSSWELRDQPYRLPEPFSPDMSPTAADLTVRIVAPETNRTFPRNFHSWTEVTDWTEELSAGQCDLTPALAEAVHQLTRDCADPLSKIRALGRYVQTLRYIALDTDLGKGAGYKPRKASQVFNQGYGDCKDKANLLKAMLKEAGVTSYPVFAHVSNDSEIWTDSPSPSQFDHAILAIVVGDNVQLPAVISAPSGDRLLIFDPTDQFTQLGDLSVVLQGAQVYVSQKSSASLVMLPRIPEAEGHLLERKATLQLAANGSVHGNVTVQGVGQSGAALRYRLFNASQPKELDQLLSTLLGEALKGSQLQNGKREDDLGSGRCGVSFEFSSAKFLQPLPNALIIARLDVLTHEAVPTFAAKERKFPVKLKPLAQSDEVILDVPAGFTVEELPAAVTLESAYGHYRRSYEARGTSVVFLRHLELKAQLVPPSDYAKLRSFFSDVGKAERAAVLLKRGA